MHFCQSLETTPAPTLYYLCQVHHAFSCYITFIFYSFNFRQFWTLSHECMGAESQLFFFCGRWIKQLHPTSPRSLNENHNADTHERLHTHTLSGRKGLHVDDHIHHDENLLGISYILWKVISGLVALNPQVNNLLRQLVDQFLFQQATKWHHNSNVKLTMGIHIGPVVDFELVILGVSPHWRRIWQSHNFQLVHNLLVWL